MADFERDPTTTTKPVVLVLMGGYWPGHDATGPNQSLRQMCKALSHECTFRIIARDRPFGASKALGASGRWIDQGFAQVRYAPVSVAGPIGLRQILRSTPHDIMLLNGFHDREFTLRALAFRRLGLIARRPTVLSTRGELAVGALGLKSPRKRIYRAIARQLGLARDVWLHATSAEEARDTERWFPWSRGVLLAPNIRDLVDVPEQVRSQRGKSSRVRLVFVGRIARVKNLAFGITVLRSVRADVDFDIYGPIEEPDYWNECEQLIARLPPNIRVRHAGQVANSEIPVVIGSADLMFLPTLGENFGHAIFEALSCDVPVLISDRTPWHNLAAVHAGWSLPLDRQEAFAAAIETWAHMPDEERQVWRRGARTRAERFVAESDAVAATRRLLAKVLAAGHPPAPPLSAQAAPQPNGNIG